MKIGDKVKAYFFGEVYSGIFVGLQYFEISELILARVVVNGHCMLLHTESVEHEDR